MRRGAARTSVTAGAAALLLALGASPAVAQERGHRGPPDAEARAEMLRERLELTDQQRERVTAILREQDQMREEMRERFREESAGQREAHREAMEQLRERTHARLGGVLDDEQMQKLEEMEKRMRRMRDDGPRGPGDGPPRRPRRP